MKLPVIHRLREDQSGAVIIEFALWSSLFFVIALTGLDYGAFLLQRSKVNEAVASAALGAFNSRDAVNFSRIPDYVRAVGNSNDLAVIISCNGQAGTCTNERRSCACLNQNGTYISASCGDICKGPNMSEGSTAGYYLTINATRRYSGMILPASVMKSANLAHNVTIRLQ